MPTEPTAEIIECRCPCHTMAALHFVPCCKICPKCGKNFSDGLEKHIEKCQATEIEGAK